MRSAKLLLASAACAALSVPAHAALLDYTLTSTSPFTATFSLDTATTPDSTTPFSFTYDDVAGVYGGTAGTADITFYGIGPLGGLVFDFAAKPTLFLLGETAFSGSTFSPTLLTGDFGYIGFKPIGFYDLSVATSVVPEPSAWALLISGFGLIGIAARRRRRQQVRVTYA